MDGVLEKCAATGLRAVGTPGAVTGDDVTGRPVLVVSQGISHRSPEITTLHNLEEVDDERVETRVESHLGGQTRLPYCVAQFLDDVLSRSQRLLAKKGFPGVHDRVDEIAMRGGRRGNHDGVNVGVQDDIVRIARVPGERAVPADRIASFG